MSGLYLDGKLPADLETLGRRSSRTKGKRKQEKKKQFPAEPRPPPSLQASGQQSAAAASLYRLLEIGQLRRNDFLLKIQEILD